MIDSLTILGLGFLLGLQHAMEPDHLVAVSTIVSRHKNVKKATISGALWGLGHTVTLLIAGIFVLALKITISEGISTSLEIVVGLVIIILGVSLIRDTIKEKKHIHKHEHNGKVHIHVHSHKHSEEHNHKHKSFLVGALHGLAGSGALMLLILATIDNLYVGLLYILIFGIGSIFGMAVLGSILNIPFTITSKKFKHANNIIKYGTGIFSICFGIVLIFSLLNFF